MRNFMYACVALASLAFAAHFVVSIAQAQEEAKPVRQPVVTPGNGRWQVVNPQPDRAMNIMLIDTVTGNTWQMCGKPDEIGSWCPMSREAR